MKKKVNEVKIATGDHQFYRLLPAVLLLLQPYVRIAECVRVWLECILKLSIAIWCGSSKGVAGAPGAVIVHGKC